MISFLTIFVITLPLLSEHVVNAATDVSHEDIRDAILSLVSIFRDNSDKLERHEFRERQLGEQLKKALAGLDKRYKSQDQNIEKLAAMILRFDERMKNFDMLMRQRDERERIQLQKSFDAIENVQATIGKMMKEIQEPAKDNTATYTVQGSDREYLQLLDTSVTSKIEELSNKLEKIQGHILNVVKLEDIGVEDNNTIKKFIKETERLLLKLDKKSDENITSNPKLEAEFASVLHAQNESLKSILEVATKACENLEKLATKSEFQEWNNTTQDILQEMKEELMVVSDQAVNKLKMKIDEGMVSVTNGQETTIKTISELQSMSENLYSDVSKSYEQLLTEIKGLSKIEQVMIQTADNVLDMKRRVEYGVHQILLEVGDLVKIQSKNLNSTINQRFDDIEETILDNQTGALTNLTSKIETEISRVWRQIGIMYQQLTASATTLDRLQEQTDTYVNGSAKTMDNVEGKVSKIATRMTELDENLNYLLGKLSLVTSEFNQIKSGLASALDNIRNNFQSTQNKIKDAGPGPRPIDNEVANALNELHSSESANKDNIIEKEV